MTWIVLVGKISILTCATLDLRATQQFIDFGDARRAQRSWHERAYSDSGAADTSTSCAASSP